MKKLLCVPLAFAMLGAVSITGCTNKDAISIMGKESDLNKPYMKQIFEHYKQSTGENLNIIAVKDAKFEDKALKRMGTKRAPDILLHFHNADLNRFNVTQNFLFLNEEEWVDELTENAKAYCTDAEGRLLGLPFWESSVSGCYYNAKLFEENGLRVPTTQADFNGLCESLKNKNITPILWPADGCSWMAQFGLDPVFADGEEGKETLEKLNAGEIGYGDIPAVTDMVTWLDNAAKSGWFGKDFLKKGWDDISPALASGEAAMTFIWDTWFYTDFTDGKYKKEDFALMPAYMGTAGTFEGGNLNMMMVNKNGSKKEKALAFLKFCAAPENYNVAFKDIPTVSVFEGQNTNIQSKMVTEAAEKGEIERYERVSTASTKIVGYSADDMMQALNALFRGDMSVAECVKRMDENRIEKARASTED